jgi:hypothetical protein
MKKMMFFMQNSLKISNKNLRKGAYRVAVQVPVSLYVVSIQVPDI